MTNPIGYIHNGFTEKFGVPRQSNLVGAYSHITFEGDYRSPEAFRGLEDYSHIWLIWGFSGVKSKTWTATVRPPRLGGNTRMGVFATRSPYRPNSLGLSSVELTEVALNTPHGPVLYVKGADLIDKTPIYDIKPYLPFTDSHPDAKSGFAGDKLGYSLNVEIACTLPDDFSGDKLLILKELLAQDPRPSYHSDASRVYGLSYENYQIKFTAGSNNLTVVSIIPNR